MPITLKLTFPAGRYHATPWGRHVNEGVAEWPPSPWRILRALVAVWRRTRRDVSSDLVRRVIEPLLTPPEFHLPPHRVAHTRHYMPWEKKGPEDRTLVFDTFVSLCRNDSLLIHWRDADLPADCRETLQSLTGNLSTLGRAESWVDVALTDETREWNCTPSDSDDNPVTVFCPDPGSALASDHFPAHDVKALKRGLKPGDLMFDCPRWHLCLDTQTIHAERWPAVPGARWLNYTRPSEFVPARTRGTRTRKSAPTVARFLLDGPVLPLATETVSVAENFRRAAMSRFESWCGRNSDLTERFRRLNVHDDESRPRFSSEILSGKDRNGHILMSQEHAYYLPTAEGNGHRRITHVTVCAPGGFGEEEVAALSSIRWMGSREDGLRVQLIGLGRASDFSSNLFNCSAVWSSVTPFLGPAHVGMRGQARYIRKAMRREWRRRSEQVQEYHGVELREVMEISSNDATWVGRPQPFEFRRARSKHGGDYRPCRLYRLVFSHPIPGPLCLGYGCHFGLGLFAALG